MNNYICPMHPEIRQDQPGRCPECGMTLLRTRTNADLHADKRRQDKHAGHSLAMFMRKFWISLVLTVPIVFYSELPQRVFGMALPGFAGLNWLILLLGSIVFFYGGWVFLVGAGREIRGRMPGMMTLIGIAITAAYTFSVFETFRGSPHTLFWELATLITIMLVGHYLEMRAVQGVQGALRELSKLLPDTAERIIQNAKIKNQNDNSKFKIETEVVSLAVLRVGDTILVKPGGRVPADGEVAEGSSEVDEALVTGESRPVGKKVGGKVIAGTINGDGSLQIRVSEIGEKTFLAGVMRLVAEAQASKSRLQILSDRAAFYLTIIALSAGALTFASWLLAGQGAITATERLVAVLVVACPHALGLAVPLVASISTTMAARKGFLVKQRLALEAARSIDVVLFDKTGTLTKGEFGVEDIVAFNDSRHPERSEGSQENRDSSASTPQNDKLVLQLAASVNQHSEHPIAKAIVAEAKKKNIELAEVKDFRRIPGKGAQAIINGEEVVVGSEGILNLNSPPHEEGKGEVAEHKVTTTPSSSPSRGGESPVGRTIIYVVKNKQVLGSIALADQIREESREAVRTLKKLGLKTAMITGDSEDVARWVAEEIRIDAYFARVLPGEKAEIVKKLQEGNFGNWKLEIGNSSRRLAVAMVGDGVNDAPALTQADLGIAIGAGTNVAIESAGIILMRNDPRDIVKIIRLSKLTYRKMIQNLFWATGYNAVALPLAAGVLANQGIILQPALAALFMSLSTVIVAINAMLLRKQKL